MSSLKKLAVLITVLVAITALASSCGLSAEKQETPGGSVNATVKAPTPRPAEEQTVFRLADNWSKDYPSVLGDKEFARLVEERSNGKLKIIVYHDAVLGDEKSVVEQMQLGGIDFARVNSAVLAKISGKVTVLSLPYLFRDSEHLWDVLLGPIGDEILASLSESGIQGLAYYDSGSRSFYSKKPMSSISDLKGMKIRVQQSEAFESIIRVLGATPVPMVFGDVYNALQKGDIDGAENNWSSYYYTNHYKVARYYILDEHTRNPEVLISSSKVMDTLSEEEKQIIISSAKDSVKFQRKEWDKVEKNSQESIKKSGAVIIPLSSEERAALQKIIAPLYEIYGKDYKDLIERIRSTK